MTALLQLRTGFAAVAGCSAVAVAAAFAAGAVPVPAAAAAVIGGLETSRVRNISQTVELAAVCIIDRVDIGRCISTCFLSPALCYSVPSPFLRLCAVTNYNSEIFNTRLHSV